MTSVLPFISTSGLVSSAFPVKISSAYKFVCIKWHSRQTGIYLSAPPIMHLSSLAAILKVKEALCLQILHIAASFLIFSHLGISSRTLENAPRWKVPPSELTITILPLLAQSSANSTISGKNWPSSMPITSYLRQVSPREESSIASVEERVWPSWVVIID